MLEFMRSLGASEGYCHFQTRYPAPSIPSSGNEDHG